MCSVKRICFNISRLINKLKGNCLFYAYKQIKHNAIKNCCPEPFWPAVLIFVLVFLSNNPPVSLTEELKSVEFGHNVTLMCVTEYDSITWRRKVPNIPLPNDRFVSSKTEEEIEGNKAYKHKLHIMNVTLSDEGIYQCSMKIEEEEEDESNATIYSYYVLPFIPPSIIHSSETRLKRKLGQSVTLFCLAEIYPSNDSFRNQIKWLKDDLKSSLLENATRVIQVNNTCINVTLTLAEIYKKENGTYSCVVSLPYENNERYTRHNITLLVLDAPQVSIDYVKAIGSSKVYLNWTVNDGNDPVQKYFVQYMPHGAPTFIYYNHAIDGRNTSYVLENFLPDTSYLIRISAKNSVGDSLPHQYHQPVRTLKQDPIFIPKVETTGSTSSTITIGWSPPKPELMEYIQYYELVVSSPGKNSRIVEEAVYPVNSRNLPYMFDNLKTATAYEFKVRACSDLTKLCGPWSSTVNGTTMDGVASKPTELRVVCLHHNETRPNSIVITWNLPENPNGKIVSYLINLKGKSTYKLDGEYREEIWGPKIRRIDEPYHKTVYDGVSSNTNYTVTISAITRHKKMGEPAVGYCTMPISAPETLGRIMWTKILTSDNKCVFKIYVPKISERNGPICCYRIYLIRMKNSNIELPHPQKLTISTYHEVHGSNSNGGAYIAEMFPGNNFKSEIFIGDGKRFLDSQGNKLDSSDGVCKKCFDGLPIHKKPTYKINKNIIVDSTTEENPKQTTAYETGSQISPYGEIRKLNGLVDSNALYNHRSRRNLKVFSGQNSFQDLEDNTFLESTNIINENESATNSSVSEIYDGEIDINSNYTGFLEIVIRDGGQVLTAYSNYFEIITPGTTPEYFNSVNDVSIAFNIAIPTFGLLIGIILLMVMVLCFLHYYNIKTSGVGEDINLRDSISRTFCGGHSGNHRHFIGAGAVKSLDIGPIHKLNLEQAFKNLHKDTDYGFLQEFEMLPNRFSDRTTKNSDLKENIIKNRYPDIKAYDQTRVKLSQINGIQYTDYINANFVIGYKERKKFICAQGPMESTINDFWRMIWEQHLEIIVMLTNLEEYNKAKCAKYWPEKVADCKHCGEIVVKFLSEFRFGDFLIRNLEIVRRNAFNEFVEERRKITQYHYLIWKDFMAPEHTHGIIKFIRAINSIYSVQRGPILVHCSAGVGRTGTFVALDILLQQLEEEDQVSIFNTVYDLRHQRNFLVQSLKQYIFLYRALLDCAVFGNTEITSISLPATIEALKIKRSDLKEKCKLELEFEKLQSVADETSKACIYASDEENACKNRHHSILPYDFNRVILSPLPMRDNSTYINASFIDGYECSDNFIITQDPLENTIADFWRMIFEQNVSTIIMLSEIGDSPRKCPRYWGDDEVKYEHILVKYVYSESCPYYTRREFNVINTKNDDMIQVTQFQYNGWPTVDGEMPEVCRGMIELVDQAQNFHSKEKNFSRNVPIVVHCSFGTERSSIFVAMYILVQQLRIEKKVDFCTTTRKLRSQRTNLLETYAQYEFLHRALANYSDLHNLSTDTSTEKQPNLM